MFVEKTTSGVNKLTNLTKTIIAVITGIITIASAVLFMEDRYMNAAAAEIMRKGLETTNVATFQQLQKDMRLEQKVIMKSREMQLLEDYYDHKVLLEETSRRNPNNSLFRFRLDRLYKKIKKLEDKIY